MRTNDIITSEPCIVYLRHPKTRHIVACIAFAVESLQWERSGRTRVVYSMSRYSKYDKFDKSLGRDIAVGRLLRSKNDYQLFTMPEENARRNDVICAIFQHIASDVSKHFDIRKYARAEANYHNSKIVAPVTTKTTTELINADL